MKAALAVLVLLGVGDAQDPAAVHLRWNFTKGEQFRLEMYRAVEVTAGPESFGTEVGTGMAFEVLDVGEDGAATLKITYDRSTAALVGKTTVTYDSDRDARPPKNGEIQYAAGMLGHPFRVRMSKMGSVLKVEGFDVVIRAAGAAVDPDLREEAGDPDEVNGNIRVNLQEFFPLLPPGPVRQADVWKGERRLPQMLGMLPMIRRVDASLVHLSEGAKTALVTETHRGKGEMEEGKGAVDLAGRMAARWDVHSGRLLESKIETLMTGKLLGQPIRMTITDDIRQVRASDPATRKRVWELLGKLKGSADPKVWSELQELGPVAYLALRTKAVAEPAGSDLRSLPESFLVKDPGDRFSDRLGMKRNMIARRGGNRRTDEAVLAALKWLSRHQNEDGSWGVAAGAKLCGRMLPGKYTGTCAMGGDAAESAVAQTGLALLAYHGDGYSTLSQDTYDGIRFGTVVSRALSFLDGIQGPDGLFHPTSVESHAIATMAIYDSPAGLADLDWTSVSARRALQALLRFRILGKGWPKEAGGASDALATSWALLAIWRAQEAGVSVPVAETAEAVAWLRSITDGKTGRAAGSKDVVAASSAAALARLALNPSRREDLEEYAGELLALETGSAVGDHFSALFLLQMLEAKPEAWKSWQGAHLLPRVDAQASTRGTCEVGSWSAGADGPGRIAMTALRCLLLETYYRFPVPIRREGDKK